MSLPRKTVLVTGASGFIGLPASEHASRNGYIVLTYFRNVRGTSKIVASVFGGVGMCFIWRPIFVHDVWVTPFSFYEANVLGTAIEPSRAFNPYSRQILAEETVSFISGNSVSR